MATKAFSDNERRAGLRLLGALEAFRELRQTMPMQYVVAFLLVALDEGQSIGAYATKAGVSPSVMSRHILDIGEYNRDREPGFGLVLTKLNLMNRREHVVLLSDKGRALFHKLARQMEV